MTYNPEYDPPLVTAREMEALIREAVHEGFTAGVEQTLFGVAGLPLTIEGRWKPDTVYEPGALVYHATEQWIAKAQTASEPSVSNALWRRANLPGMQDDTNTPRI